MAHLTSDAFSGFSEFSGVPFTLNASAPTGNLDPAFADLLEFEPEIPFQGALSRANLAPQLFRRFQGQRSRFFNQFLARQDEDIRAGLAPTERFADFINQPGFFQEQANQLSPSERFGFGSAQRFSPRTAFR